MYLNKMQKREKVKTSNTWFDTKEEIKKMDLPEAYGELENSIRSVLDMWVCAHLKPSNTNYMG